jgi:lipopolysaccharide export LptBFGC system permease protein LptF
MKIIGIVVLCIMAFAALWIFGHGMKHADKIADDAIINYEEYQEIYNTCQKINGDMGNIKAVTPDDKMFSMISKEAMLVAKRQQMNRWVQEYNAKSKMWNRSMWKSGKLPYQLHEEDFNNY